MTKNEVLNGLKVSNYIEYHNRDTDRISSDGIVEYAVGDEKRMVDSNGNVYTRPRVNDNATTNVSTSFGTWETINNNRPGFVEIQAFSETDGTTKGEVAVDIDETGDGTADFTFTVSLSSASEGAGTNHTNSVSHFVTASGQYRITNVSDPNGVNSINVVREVKI